jgi:hypothetical protein
MSKSDELLEKINKAVAVVNEAHAADIKASEEHRSKGKALGLLLIKAKDLHPKVADFRVYLESINGLGLSRAYDYMKLAGGRTTDAKLREETRKRVKKHRDKKKALPKPTPAKADKVTLPGGAAIDVDALGAAARAQLAEQLNGGDEQGGQFVAEPEAAPVQPEPGKDSVTVSESPERIRDSARNLAEFIAACKAYLVWPKLTEADMETACAYVWTARANCQFKNKKAAEKVDA